MKFIIILNFIVYSIVIFRPMTTKVYLFQFLYNKCEQESTIYFTDNNPFEEITFYKQKKLVLKKMDIITEKKLTNEYPKKYIITIPEKKHLFKNKTLIYQTYPNWLKNFNIGNWMGKSEQYLIYKI